MMACLSILVTNSVNTTTAYYGVTTVLELSTHDPETGISGRTESSRHRNSLDHVHQQQQSARHHLVVLREKTKNQHEQNTRIE